MQGSFLSTTKGTIGASGLSLAAGIGVSAALLAGGVAGDVAIGLTGLIAAVGFVFLVVARSEWHGEVAQRARARRDDLLRHHHKELIDHAKWMMTQLQNEATPFLADDVESQFQQHFPDLTRWVTGWWNTIHMVQRNPRLGPRTSPEQPLADRALRSVMRGNVEGICGRCEEIAADFSRVALRSPRPTTTDPSPLTPGRESEDKS